MDVTVYSTLMFVVSVSDEEAEACAYVSPSVDAARVGDDKREKDPSAQASGVSSPPIVTYCLG